MEDANSLNDWRLAELIDRMKTHFYNNDLTVIMKRWDCVRKNRYEVHTEDDVLVCVTNDVTMDFYPSGYFECGGCHKLAPLSHEHHAFFNYNRDCMICTSCNNRYKHTMVPAYPLMCARIFGEPELDDTEHIRFITVHRPASRAAIQRKIAIKRAERVVAANPDLHYFDGKSTTELYHDLLARRVVRRFRLFITARLRLKVAWVISAVTNINRTTAHDIVAASIVAVTA